jgi:hypothetical protein
MIEHCKYWYSDVNITIKNTYLVLYKKNSFSVKKNAHANNF